jgi:hypothetical protein
MRLPLFPLNTVLFPGMALPLHIFEPRYREMIGRCLRRQTPFGVVLIRAGAEVGGGAEPYLVGTTAHITRSERLADGRMNIETVGQERFRILALHQDEAYLTGTVELFPLQEPDISTAQAAAQALRPWVARYLRLFGQAAEVRLEPAALPETPTALAYLAAMVVQAPLADKQTLLGQPSATAMLVAEREVYRRELSLLQAMLTSPQSQHDPQHSPN